jgi:hypothetical protein
MQILCRAIAFRALFTLRTKRFHDFFTIGCQLRRRRRAIPLKAPRETIQMKKSSTSLTPGFPLLRQPKSETADRGTLRFGDANVSAGFPPLRQPKPETADRGTLRFGDANVSAGFPPLRQPKPETADRGTLRFGDANVSAGFPPRR